MNNRHIHHLCVDTGYRLKDLLRVMVDRDSERDSKESILLVSLDDNDESFVFTPRLMTILRLIVRFALTYEDGR